MDQPNLACFLGQVKAGLARPNPRAGQFFLFYFMAQNILP